MRKERVRFAPSPTGRLHIGNARTAMFNYLYAAQNEGVFILRIEDTDVERSAREYEEQLIDALEWLGFEWEEGPGRNGRYGPYRQSERLELYREHAEELIGKGRAYYCYCTDEELEKSRQEMLRAGMAPKYSGTCRNLPAEERKVLSQARRRPCIRFRTPGSGLVRFQDKIHGLLTFRTEDIGDFVLMRSNGMPSYNFAVVVDDHHMDISMVIRGEDHLPNTPRQVLLYREFGWEIPLFAHHALLMGADGAKLSKRHGVTSVEAFRDMGILPEALINYFALLGGNLVEGREIFTPGELADSFSIKRAGKSAAIFSLQRLLWVNQQHLRQKSPKELAGLFLPFLERAGYSFVGKESAWMEEVASIMGENVKTLKEARTYAPIFFDELPEYTERVRGNLANPVYRDIINAFHKRFEISPSNDKKDLSALLEDTRLELRQGGRVLFLALRMAITGMESGPELDRILPLLGPEIILKRLREASGIQS
ncbi:MAG: glutamate--tRNA ligase [Syntrophobacteraceae bacterium]